MGPAEGSGGVAGRVARPGAGGVVSRPGLFDRLAASARVTVVSAPPGSGKTGLLRSWIGEAGVGGRARGGRGGAARGGPAALWGLVRCPPTHPLPRPGARPRGN